MACWGHSRPGGRDGPIGAPIYVIYFRGRLSARPVRHVSRRASERPRIDGGRFVTTSAPGPVGIPVPERTQVLVAGGGPVGLAVAVELGMRGIKCVVVEPRAEVSRARPRCKTVNVRTMEHLRRWGLADRLRERAPLPVSWSQDIVFCTSLAGHELSRFSRVLGLSAEGDRFPEVGQQAPSRSCFERSSRACRAAPWLRATGSVG